MPGAQSSVGHLADRFEEGPAMLPPARAGSGPGALSGQPVNPSPIRAATTPRRLSVRKRRATAASRLARIFADIYVRLNQTYMSSKSEPVVFAAAPSIEHILPQTWQDHWPLPDGSRG